MIHRLIFCLFCFVISASALSDTLASKFKEKYLNLGTHTEFYNSVQNDASGGQRKFDIAPTIGIGGSIPLSNSFYFIPEFNWVLPQMLEGSKIMINTFMLRGDLAVDPMDWLRLRLGTSLMWQNQQGRGGTANMNNGNGTSTFYYPDENRSSLNNTLDLGAETIFDQFSIRLQTYVYSVFKQEQRQISYSLFFTYYWEKGTP